MIKSTRNWPKQGPCHKQGDIVAAGRIRPSSTGGWVGNNGPLVASEVAHKVVESFHLQSGVELYPGVLSKREWEVLIMLARGFKYQEIADDLCIGVASVNTYIRRTYRKLRVSSRARAVVVYLQSISEASNRHGAAGR